MLMMLPIIITCTCKERCSNKCDFAQAHPILTLSRIACDSVVCSSAVGLGFFYYELENEKRQMIVLERYTMQQVMILETAVDGVRGMPYSLDTMV